MTEQSWATERNPEMLLNFVVDRASDRKFRFFVVACSRRVLPSDADDAMIASLDGAERFADGSAKKVELTRLRSALAKGHSKRAKTWNPLYTTHVRSVPAWHAIREAVAKGAAVAARTCAWSSTRTRSFGESVTMTWPETEYQAQVALVHDIFANPFRPVTFAPTWRSATAKTLAQTMYDARDFAAMPILADALEDAGCDHPDVLAHCRGSGPHVRGCWVVDLVLGKS